MITDLIGVVGSVLCVIPDTWAFFIGRLLGGYTSGAFAAVAPTFIRDISPVEISGKTGSLV
jgi:MFS family permease